MSFGKDTRGGRGDFSVLAIFQTGFSAFKLRFFGFCVCYGFEFLRILAFGFRFSAKIQVVFRIWYPTRFSVLPVWCLVSSTTSARRGSQTHTVMKLIKFSLYPSGATNISDRLRFWKSGSVKISILLVLYFIFCFSVSGELLSGFSVSNRLQCPPHTIPNKLEKFQVPLEQPKI